MLDHLAKIRDAAARLGESESADILIFNGEIVRNVELNFISTVFKRNRRQNIVLILVTTGGDADAAYRIGRCLQKYYETTTVFVSGLCKNAGALVATAANRLVFSEFGELGPLRVQLPGKQREAVGYQSELDVEAAVKRLGFLSGSLLESVAPPIEQAGGGLVTLQAATEIACNLTSSLFGNIYSKIDPRQIGQTARAQATIREYGQRLADHSWNFQAPDSLELLVSSYPSGDFVIDAEEAQTLFKNVAESRENFEVLREALGEVGLYPMASSEQGDFMLAYLNREN